MKRLTFKKLNLRQLERLSEFSSNLSLVFFGGMIIPIISGGLDTMNPIQLIWGLGGATIFLIIAKQETPGTVAH